jgi:hypothetical protein
VNPPYTPGPIGNSELNLLNGDNIKGTVHLVFYDRGYAVPPATAQTSILNSVSVKFTPQKPVK